MSNILLLPLCQAQCSVQSNEDLLLAFTFLQADGSALDLTGIAFAAYLSIGPFGIASMAGLTFGGGNNNLVFAALAADKQFLDLGPYSLTIVATDGVFTRDILGRSTLMVGPPLCIELTPMLSDGSELSTMNVIPFGLITASPLQTANAIASLSASDLSALRSALFQSVPNVQGGDAVPAAGAPFINASGYYVVAQDATGPSTLVNNVFGALSDVRNGDTVPPAGQPYINTSGFVEINK